ncbi:MAG: hypothetical protein WCS37_04215 [Chloroflexota bacterium]|nr:hypothetical protein [Chloroflexota bacterium]
MRKYDKEPRRNYFGQGFRLGLIFGTLGALIILGRDQSPQQTLETPPAETTETKPVESVNGGFAKYNPTAQG